MKFKLSKKYIITISVLVLTFFLYAKFVYSPVIFKILDRYKEFNTTGVPDGLTSLSAKECGGCHTAIYNEWRTSMHSKAYTDPYFKAWFKKDNEIWVCLYCHTQLERQMKFKVDGFVNGDLTRPILEINDEYEEGLEYEGVTCAVCHVYDGVIHGPFKDVNAPHPTKYDEIFTTTTLCRRCHEVPKDGLMFYKDNPCGTVEEYENGPYAEKGFICQTCHMPEKFRALTDFSKIYRRTGQHTFKGAYSMEMLEKALHIELDQKGDRFELRVMNNGVGHKFPSGDPDRYVLIITKFYDKQGKLLKKEVERFGRTIMYRPIIIEFYDSRLKPLVERSYEYKGSDLVTNARRVTVEVEYHILSDRAHKKLIKKYGLPKDTQKLFKLKPLEFRF